MTQSWRSLTVAAVLSATLGVGTAAAQTVMARHMPAGDRLEVMLNGSSAGTGAPDETGDAKVTVQMRDAIGKSEIDANLYIDHCGTTHRVWIMEVGRPIPSEGTCDLRSVSGLYWVRPVNTIVVNDITDPAPTVLLLKGSYTPPEPGAETAPGGPARDLPAGLILFAGAGLTTTNDAIAVACGDVSSCSGHEAGLGFAAGGEFRFKRIFSAEVGYTRPATVTTSGSETTFRFTTSQKMHLFTLAGKIGAPIGIAKLYGKGGVVYHQAKIVTNQTQDPRTVTVEDASVTVPGGTQSFELKTDGWGWLLGGGLEMWVSQGVAIYGEFDYGSVKGNDVNGGEGRIDNKVASILLGLRVHLGK